MAGGAALWGLSQPVLGLLLRLPRGFTAATAQPWVPTCPTRTLWLRRGVTAPGTVRISCWHHLRALGRGCGDRDPREAPTVQPPPPSPQELPGGLRTVPESAGGPRSLPRPRCQAAASPPGGSVGAAPHPPRADTCASLSRHPPAGTTRPHPPLPQPRRRGQRGAEGPPVPSPGAPRARGRAGVRGRGVGAANHSYPRGR